MNIDDTPAPHDDVLAREPAKFARLITIVEDNSVTPCENSRIELPKTGPTWIIKDPGVAIRPHRKVQQWS
jgi:hypothetical protein